MKQIINGIKYDTSTAWRVFQYNVGNYGDSPTYDRVVYKKKNGEFFTHRVDMEDIMPITEEVAIDHFSCLRWPTKDVQAEQYELIFGEVSE